jgi:hypothetical protein
VSADKLHLNFVKSCGLCRTRQIQARPLKPWKGCSVFVPAPPAGALYACLVEFELDLHALLQS